MVSRISVSSAHVQHCIRLIIALYLTLILTEDKDEVCPLYVYGFLGEWSNMKDWSVTSSSTYDDMGSLWFHHSPFYVIDGLPVDDTTNLGGNCFANALEGRPWIQIKLGEQSNFVIEQIHVMLRQHPSMNGRQPIIDRFVNIEATVGFTSVLEDHFLCALKDSIPLPLLTTSYTFDCGQKLVGKYIALVSKTDADTHMDICEVSFSGHRRFFCKCMECIYHHCT